MPETPWTVPTSLLCPWNSPGRNTRVGIHSILQGIFLTQGSNRGLSHCRQILYSLSHQGNPVIGLLSLNPNGASLIAPLVKNPPAMQETWVRFLGWEDPLGKGKAPYSSILTWRIPWYSLWGHKSETTEWLSLSPFDAGAGTVNSISVLPALCLHQQGAIEGALQTQRRKEGLAAALFYCGLPVCLGFLWASIQWRFFALELYILLCSGCEI